MISTIIGITGSHVGDVIKVTPIAPVDLLVLHGGVLHSVVTGIDLKDYAIALHIVVIDHVARLQVLRLPDGGVVQITEDLVADKVGEGLVPIAGAQDVGGVLVILVPGVALFVVLHEVVQQIGDVALCSGLAVGQLFIPLVVILVLIGVAGGHIREVIKVTPAIPVNLVVIVYRGIVHRLIPGVHRQDQAILLLIVIVDQVAHPQVLGLPDGGVLQIIEDLVTEEIGEGLVLIAGAQDVGGVLVILIPGVALLVVILEVVQQIGDVSFRGGIAVGQLAAGGLGEIAGVHGVRAVQIIQRFGAAPGDPAVLVTGGIGKAIPIPGDHHTVGAAAVQLQQVAHPQVLGVVQLIGGDGAEYPVAEHIGEACLTGAAAQDLGGIDPVGVPLVKGGVFGLQLPQQIGDVLLRDGGVVRQAVGVVVGGGQEGLLLLEQGAEDHRGLRPGGAVSAVEAALVIAAEEALGIGVEHRILVIGGNGGEILDPGAGVSQGRGGGILKALVHSHMIHNLGHIIAADLGLGNGGAPISGGSPLLGGLSALQDAGGIGRVEIGPPPVRGAALGGYLVLIEHPADHGDKVGVGQLFLRAVPPVSQAGDQPVGGGLGDVGISPVA